MVCPYCSTSNIPHTPACAHCGVLLRVAPSGRRPPLSPHLRRARRRRLAAGLSVLGGAAAGGALLFPFVALAGVGAGVLTGAGLGLSLSAGGRTYRGNLLRARHAALAVRLRNALAAAEHRYEAELGRKQGSWEGRLHLALVHALEDEWEKSWSEFEQARSLGAPDDQWYNNAGVALARRGETARAVEFFSRAGLVQSENPAPPANLAHADALLAAGGSPEANTKAVQQVQCALVRDSQNPSYFNRLGLILCGEDRADEALRHFDRALELAGKDAAQQADARSNRGIARFLNGDAADAAAEFEAALKLDPGHGRALCNLGVLRVHSGALPEALVQLQLACGLDDRSALLWSNLGVVLCRSESVNEGILAFRDALLRNPLLFEAHYNLGKVYADAFLPDLAERYLQRALALRPRSPEALTTMGVVKALMGQTPLAAKHFARADELRPRQTRILLNLGLCETLAGNFVAAARHFKQVSQIAKDDPEPYAHLGWMLLKQGSTAHAGDELKLALHKNEKLAHAHNNYGLCLIFGGSYDGALLHFKRALHLDPTLVGVHYQIGCAQALLDQMEQAVKSWEAAAIHEPGHIDNFVNLGVGWYKLGKWDEAVREFARVLTGRQERMHDFSNLGLAYAKQGMALRADSRNPGDAKARAAVAKHRQAVEMLDKALALEPANVMLHSNRGLACFFGNRPEDAMEEWALVTRLDPNYAKKRAKIQQSEFDDTPMHFIPLHFAARALAMPFQTAELLSEFAPGYDTDEWALSIGDPALAAVPAMKIEMRRLERRLHALHL